jgi:hypothetical protein
VQYDVSAVDVNQATFAVEGAVRSGITVPSTVKDVKPNNPWVDIR